MPSSSASIRDARDRRKIFSEQKEFLIGAPRPSPPRKKFFSTHPDMAAKEWRSASKIFLENFLFGKPYRAIYISGISPVEIPEISFARTNGTRRRSCKNFFKKIKKFF